MEFQIDPQFVAQVLQLGGQYLIPVAALLRAIYSGIRGRFPEGLAQIGAASLFAGLTAVADNVEFDWRVAVVEVLGNTVFMAGLLAFIMTYLLRQPNRGRTFDGIVGAVIGGVVFVVWTFILGNDWPVWLLPLVVIAGAAAFIALRVLLRQIGRLVKIATYFIIAGVVAVVIGGGLLLLQALLNQPAA